MQPDVVARTPATTAWIGSTSWERNPDHLTVVPGRHVENMLALFGELAADMRRRSGSRSP